jgi:hypothetical protein
LSSDIQPSPSPHYIHPAHLPLSEIKQPTIAKIELSQEDLAELQRVLQSKRMCPWSKDARQRKIVGMCGCGQVPDYIMTKYYEGAKVIEKYCVKCMDKTTIEKNKVVESVSELTRNHPRSTDQ